MNLRTFPKALVMFLVLVSTVVGCSKKVTNEQVHTVTSEPVHKDSTPLGTPNVVADSAPITVDPNYDPFVKKEDEKPDTFTPDVTSTPELTSQNNSIRSSQEPDYRSEDQRISEQIKEIDRQISDLNRRMEDEPIDNSKATTQWECFRCGRTFWFYSVQPHTHRTGPCPEDATNGNHAWMKSSN